VHIVKNYTGDVMNFEMAADLGKDAGIEVQSVVVDDDVDIRELVDMGGVANAITMSAVPLNRRIHATRFATIRNVRPGHAIAPMPVRMNRTPRTPWSHRQPRTALITTNSLTPAAMNSTPARTPIALTDLRSNCRTTSDSQIHATPVIRKIHHRDDASRLTSMIRSAPIVCAVVSVAVVLPLPI
jgi:hypothetical protein